MAFRRVDRTVYPITPVSPPLARRLKPQQAREERHDYQQVKVIEERYKKQTHDEVQRNHDEGPNQPVVIRKAPWGSTPEQHGSEEQQIDRNDRHNQSRHPPHTCNERDESDYCQPEEQPTL